MGGVGGVLMRTGKGSQREEGQETRASREEKGSKGERRINEKGKGRGRKPRKEKEN